MVSPALGREEGGGRGRGLSKYLDLGLPVIRLYDGDAQGCDPLHGPARVRDEVGALGQPVLRG